MKIILTWEENKEVNLAGYRLYISRVSGSYSFGETRAIRHIPINRHHVEVNNLADGIWYFVITDFNVLGLESPESNEVVVNTIIQAPRKLCLGMVK